MAHNLQKIKFSLIYDEYKILTNRNVFYIK